MGANGHKQEQEQEQKHFSKAEENLQGEGWNPRTELKFNKYPDEVDSECQAMEDDKKVQRHFGPNCWMGSFVTLPNGKRFLSTIEYMCGADIDARPVLEDDLIELPIHSQCYKSTKRLSH